MSVERILGEKIATAMARAEAAERKVAAVETLADEWESTETIPPSVPRRLRAAIRDDA